MKLRPRLALSHGIIIGLMCLVFPLALYSLQRMAERVNSLAATNLQANAAIEQISEQLNQEIAGLIQTALRPPNEATTADTDATTALTPPAPASGPPTPNLVRQAIDAARGNFMSPTEKSALDDFEARYMHFENAVAIWQAGRMAQPNTIKLPSDFGKLRKSLAHLRDLKNTELRDAAQATRRFARDMILLVGVLATLALLTGLFATVRLVRSVTDLSDRLTALVQRMSGGDFDVAYTDGPIDEFNALGHHFESMAHSLHLFRETNMERLIVEQRRSEAVLDSIGDGLVIFSEEGRIERINPVAERQLRMESGQAIGRRFEEIGDEEIGERVREVLASGEFSEAREPEISIEHEGEKRILAYWLHRFVESESGRPGVVLVMRDVTTRREFDQMRGEFVLRASHELRTPITSIRMGLGLLGEKLQFPEGSRDRELYDTVQAELKRMVSLLTDLLDLSRLRVGEQSLERLPTDIEQVLRKASQRFELPAAEASVKLEMEIDDELPRLSLSRSAFDRVLDNLIGNALRYTPSGGSIMLSAHRTPEHIAIAVTDTGQGIPFSRQALVFQPFVQVGQRRGGAGLGLAICKEIVEQHGGRISVSSLPRRGTTFTILMPA